MVFQPCLQLPAPVIPQETIHEDQDFVHVPTAVQGVLSDGVGLPIADTTNDIVLMSLTEHKENENYDKVMSEFKELFLKGEIISASRSCASTSFGSWER